jgi:hypothetical protein
VATTRAARARGELDPKQAKKLAWWVERLKADVFCGDQIPKDRIPRGLSERNGIEPPVENAWRFELPGAFRGIYTVANEDGRKPAVIVLEILSHKEYDRLFGYR